MQSLPLGTSRKYGLMAGSAAASRAITTGGFGLFFDPGCLPLGRRTTSIMAPSPALSFSGRAVAAPGEGASLRSGSPRGKYGEKGWRPGGYNGNMFGGDGVLRIVVSASK